MSSAVDDGLHIDIRSKWLLIANGTPYGTPLREACYEGHVEIVKLLLAKNADVDAQKGFYGPALQTALVHGNQVIVGLLVAKGAS
jgi:ankyrin repeat protein